MDTNLPPPPKAAAPPVLPPGAGGPLPPNVTPGWNDPPKVSANSPATGPKRLLNKRVPFPMAPSQSPQNSLDILDTHVEDAVLNEISSSFYLAIQQLPNNAGLKKDMERFSTNWKDVAGSREVKDLLLQAAQHVKNGDVAQSEHLHKQLSLIPAAGWFTLFLHSIIMALSSQKTDL